MSDHLLAVAETTKLARLLNVDDRRELDFLVDLPPAAIRLFRERATDLLFDGDAARLERIAAASKLVPVAISAKAAELAFGPILCAALAAAIEPSRGVAVAQKLSASFLAQTSIQLDPRRAASMIGVMPAPIIAAVAGELLRLGDHVTMGRFVGVLPESSLRAAVPIMSDADLLEVGFLLEDKSGIDSLLNLVRDRLPGIIRAAHEQDLWAEGIDMLHTVSPENRALLGDIAAGQGDDVLDGLIRAADRLQAWETLLPVTRAMSRENLAVFAQRPAVHEKSTLSAIMTVALDNGHWIDLLPLAAQLPEPQREFIADRVADESDTRLGQLVSDADEAGEWESMIPIAMAMNDTDRRRMAGLPIMAEAKVLRGVLATCAEHDLWSETLPLVDALPDAATPILASCIGDMTSEQLLSAVLTAASSQNVRVLVDVALAQDEAGRRRVLELIDGMDEPERFVRALTEETPTEVWEALVSVRAEIPDALRGHLTAQARVCERDDVAAQLAAS